MRRRATVKNLGVVIPARDEEDLLPACLDAVERARRVALGNWSGVRTQVVVVLDSWTTDLAAVSHAVRRVESVVVRHGAVGPTRAAGVEQVRRGLGATRPHDVWIANTDADTVVPENWLDRQLAFAADGFDLVVGSVEPDAAGLDPRVLAAWRDRHHLVEGHPYVHGANLGFRLDGYDLVGGFEPVAHDEDVRLVERMREAGLAWCATTTTHAVTSGRHVGRAPGGLSGYLTALSDVAGSRTIGAGEDLERNPA
jgi:hypothetical protein